MKGKYTKTVIKFQRSIAYGDSVLMYNKDRSILGEQPMDKIFEVLFNGRLKIYCECKFRHSDGYLEIGKEVKADW